MKVLLPNTVNLSPVLPSGWSSVVVDATAPIAESDFDAEVLVVWGASAGHLASAAKNLKGLRLVQALSAGTDSVLAAGFSPGIAVASGAGLHDRTVTEHGLALLLTMLRRLPDAAVCQVRHEWSANLGGIQPLHPADRVTTLIGANVVIWGFGSIAQTMAPILAALGASVTGIAHSAGRRGGFDVVAAESALDVLSGADVLICLLPAATETERLIGDPVFAALPDRALFVNLGRGRVVDQAALVRALESHAIAGAAIDVADPEPLPETSVLWAAPRLIITPHAAGGRPIDADERISRNITALVEGGQFLHRVR